jgi:large subunit ribosomal protein L15
MATRLRRHRKFRGLRTHGRGKKAGRGKGKRGGTGNAGLHKHKWIWTLKYDPDHFGRHGFKRPQKMLMALITINVKELEQLPEGEHVKVGKDGTVIDLVGLGIDKLLGGGRTKTKFEVTVDRASASAVEKIQAAGGKITVVIPPEPEKPKDDKAAKGGKEQKGGDKGSDKGAAKQAQPQKNTANVKTPKPDAPSSGKGGDKAGPKPKPEKKP